MFGVPFLVEVVEKMRKLFRGNRFLFGYFRFWSLFMTSFCVKFGVARLNIQSTLKLILITSARCIDGALNSARTWTGGRW